MSDEMIIDVKIKNNKSAIDELDKTMEGLTSTTKKTSKGVDELGNEVKKTGKRKSELDKVKEGLKGVEKGAKEAKSGVNVLAGGFKSLASAMLPILSVAAVVGFVKKSLDAFEDFEKGMKQNTEDIKKANEDLAAALKKNEELEGKIKKANEELENIGKALDEVMKKGVSNPETEEKKETEALQKFLRTGEAGNLRVAKAISSTQVAVLIPSALEREILKEIKENSPFLFNARIYTGKESYRRVPIRNEITPKNQAVKEGVGNTQSGEISYTYIDIKAGKRQVPYPLTDEAREDAFADLVGEIKEAVAEDFGITLSDLTINGTYNETADQFIEGFMTNADVKANAVTSATAGKVTWEDMVKLETGMKKQYRKNAKYYVSLKMYEEMKLWKDTTDRQLWSTIHNGATMVFNGYEVVVDEFLDDIATGKFPAIFCDFKKGYGYYIKNDFEQETNRKVNEGITEIYTRIRIGGKVLRPNAFKPLKVK